VESLTDELASLAWRRFQEIESAGGFLAVVENGALLREIETVRAARTKAIATRKAPITGVSTFPLLDEKAVELDEADAAAYAALQAPPAGPDDLALEPWPRLRLAEPFERLRDAADHFTARTGTRPAVLLLTLGTLAEHTVRATWIKGLLAAGGIEARESSPLDDEAAVAEACRETGLPLAVLCSSDARYAELAEAAARSAKDAGIRHLYLAGRPGEAEATWRGAGIDGFLYQGMDVLAELEAMHDRLIAED
ncbi:MAG: methylmalonyl-CoA mutase family protein, partial [Pseudomonadota bacterium]